MTATDGHVLDERAGARHAAATADPAERYRSIEWPAGRDLWVFGYGSLMWRPGFRFVEAAPARLFGYHRAFCIRSMVHRGTPDRPGLVLGLAAGGSCLGRAYRVAAAAAPEVLDYLAWRELRRDTYLPRRVGLRLPQGRTEAVSFVANPRSIQYAGGLTLAEMADLVRDSSGESGTAHDYLVNAIRHLAEFGIRDVRLERLLAHVETRTPDTP